MPITKRDLEIFKLISRTAISTTAQINQMIFKGVATTTVLRRLRKLEKGKFINRIEGLPNHELAWVLTLSGANSIGYVNPKRHFHRLSLVHDVKLAELRLTLEGHGIAHSWIPEHEIRSAIARKHGLKRLKSQSVPDGIMGVSYNGAMESVAIELELHYKNKDRYREIFESYIGKRNVKAVWYFVPSESLGKHLEKLWTKYIGRMGPWLLWSLLDDVLENSCSAAIHYFNESYEVSYLFLPAHPGGLGVSNLESTSSEKKINLTPQDQKENLVDAS